MSLSVSPNVVSIPDVKVQSDFWTDDRVRELRRYISEDRLFASQAASLLGCTKNMVIGKCNRMKIAIPLKRRAIITLDQRRQNTRERNRLYRKRIKKERELRHIENVHTGRWAESPTLNPFPALGCCLFGCGDPGEPGFHFCGEPNLPGKAYCAVHCASAYVKPADSDRVVAL
jgi:GcrA cell cycle regulator